jgi:hypothetical protein
MCTDFAFVAGGTEQYNGITTKDNTEADCGSQPMKLTNEILTAAIAGFEQQKKAIDERVAAMRQIVVCRRVTFSMGRTSLVSALHR